MTEEKFLIYHGSELFVRTITGKGEDVPTLIFLHDSLGCVTLWRDLPERLAEETGLNAVIYDRRGYGRSSAYDPGEKRSVDYMTIEAEVLEWLISQLAIKNCILFGHSDGATIALIAASRCPELVNACIITGPHIYVEPVTRKGVADTFDTYLNTDLRQRLEKYHGHRTDALVRIWADIWLSDRFGKWNISQEVSEIKCPLLIMQGENDEFGTMQQVRDIKNLSAGDCKIIEIPDAGHTPFRDHSDMIITESADFINQLDLSI